MLLHYHLLNVCLAELAKLRHHDLLKIRLEIVVIQLKRLLLDERVAACLGGNADSEEWFLALHDGFLRLGQSPEIGQGIDELIASVAELRSRVEQAAGLVALPALTDPRAGQGKSPG